MGKLLYQIAVKGKVQGVWFRKYTSDKAKSIGLTGFVRNEMDKTVYIEAEGTLEQLKEFVNWLYQGSPLSRVSTVVFRVGEIKHCSTFEILD